MMQETEKGQPIAQYASTDDKDGVEIKSHDDEAANVLSTYDGPSSWTGEEERKLLRKIDWRLMPVLCITCTRSTHTRIIPDTYLLPHRWTAIL